MKIFRLLILLAIFVSCVSNQPKEKETAAIKNIDQDIDLDYKIVEHKGSMFGSATPTVIHDAVLMNARDFAEQYFPNSYVFVASETGRDLDGLKSWAKNFSIQSEISRMVSTSVESSFNGLQTGTRDALGAAMETFTRTITQAEFSGLGLENDWWFKRKHFKEDGSSDYVDYQYIVIYTVPRELLDQQIGDLLNGSISDRDDRSAMEKLQAKLAEDGYGLDNGEQTN